MPESDLLNTMVLSIPNFVFASIAIFALMQRLKNQDVLVNRLIEKWEKCEDNNDTQTLLATKKAGE